MRHLIGMVNGTAKWDSDTDLNGQTSKHAFSTSNDYENDYACAGYTASTRKYDQPWPLVIWYEFPSSHVPARFSFRRVDISSTPKTWKFVGSKDEDCGKASTWVELCGDLVGDKYLVEREEVGCDVPRYAIEPFKCLGIRALLL